MLRFFVGRCLTLERDLLFLREVLVRMDLRWANDAVKGHNQFLEPAFTFGAFGQGHGDIATAMMLDNGTVGMIGPPCTGFSINF
jgi:hypothetical protein